MSSKQNSDHTTMSATDQSPDQTNMSTNQNTNQNTNQLTTSTKPTSPEPFKPFFTLIRTPSGDDEEESHPKVQYIFSDDDTNLLTESILTSIDPHQPSNIENRSILIDISPTGEVEKCVSLAKEWQVVDTEVRELTPLEGERGRMVTIFGVGMGKEGRDGRDASRRRGTTTGKGRIEGLAKEFGEGVDLLGVILGRG
ncbi:hypothetical protein K470DRAFT_255015 [Piedraia hortae CBS 480.64]|uniref:Uncharacterized protein n=1 Tax=Piedraia hortae CBS 480.64 TaxID=1314780 RepID=A0A6A7C7C2_9PEZI|nr:hypothetical protein K470DRAFT_255015 [Piedraia hortae CBS 480.64]